MSLPKPNLDDIKFEELVDEAKKLIPIYAPDWTDFNVHDPGITLIELFAWLTEIQNYRINQIREKNQLKFLKLLGIKPMPSAPAKVDVTFSLTKDYTGPEIPKIGKETQVAAINGETGADIIFELDLEPDQQLNVVPLTLKKIVSKCWDGIRDGTSANDYDGHYYLAFGEEVKESDSLYLGFEYVDDKNEAIEFASSTLTLMVYLYQEDLIEIGRHGDENPEIFSAVKLKWEYWDDGWKIWKNSENPPENQIIDETQNFTSNGLITFKGNEEDVKKPFNLKRTIIPPYEDSLFWIRCTVERKPPDIAPSSECKKSLIRDDTASDILYDIPPRIESIQLNTVSATQGETIKNEGIGSSSGLPHQKFVLKNKPVIAESLAVSIADQACLEVGDFDASGPEDAHYVFDPDNGEILWGDGVNGFIPPQGSEIKVTYRAGGGEMGNVKAKTVNKIISPALSGVSVNNLQDASGGAGKENVEEAIIRLRKDLKEPYQAVTPEDYEHIAKATPGLRVKRAKTISDHEKNRVEVIVVPEVPGGTVNKPEPSEGFLKTVYMHLCKHRLITTQIEVKGPEYVEISVTATVKIKREYEAEKVRERIEDALKRFLHPLTGGSLGNGWPFGRTVFRSEVYEVIDDVEGADCVRELSMKDGTYKFDGDKIEIPENALVYSKRHEITILGPEEECRRRDGFS